MKKKIAELWVKALRSGEFKQGTRYLDNNGKYCCLGVLSVLGLVEGVCEYEKNSENHGIYNKSRVYLPTAIQKWAGIESSGGEFTNNTNTSLAELNDVDRLNFDEIADYIEKNWRNL